MGVEDLHVADKGPVRSWTGLSGELPGPFFNGCRS